MYGSSLNYAESLNLDLSTLMELVGEPKVDSFVLSVQDFDTGRTLLTLSILLNPMPEGS